MGSTSRSNENIKQNGLRGKIKHLMDRPKFHILIISLVMLDLCLVMTELVLSLYVAEGECSKTISRDTIENLDKAEEIVGHISFALLCVFVLEVIVRMWATGFKTFFKRWFNYVDVVVVFGSFIVDLLFSYIKIDVGHDGSNYSKVLIVLRMIRIIRMLHAVAHAVEMMDEEKIEKLKEDKRDLEERLEMITQ